MDILRKLLLGLVLFSFPLGELARYSFNNGISFTLADVLTIALFLLFLSLYATKKVSLSGKLKKPFFLFTFFAAISLLFNIFSYTQNQFIISSLYLLRWIILGSLYFSTLQLNRQNKEKLLLAMLIAGWIFTFFGYVQYFFLQ
ncbi:MAG: hypothetical protein M1365_07780 [Actinobacteria bacterium]|nr:hypothetical protein [Actinomycetota bacterium]